MKRIAFLFCCLLWALPSGAQFEGLHAQDLPLDVKGEGVKVITVVEKLPFTVTAPPGAALYFWQYPANVQVLDKGDKLDVLGAPKGTLVIGVKTVVIDFDKKMFFTKFGSVTVQVGIAPVVVVDPKDPVVDPNNPAPIPDAGLHALFIYETADRLSPGQAAIISSATLIEFLNNGWKWRKFDKDVDLSKAAQPWAKAAMRPRKSVPWVIISNGKTGFEGPWPDTVADMIALLRKYGGGSSVPSSVEVPVTMKEYLCPYCFGAGERRVAARRYVVCEDCGGTGKVVR